MREIQLMMLMEETTTRPATLLSRALYYTGLSGLTFSWDAIPGMAYHPLQDSNWKDGAAAHGDNLITQLYEHCWQSVRAY